MSEEAKKQSAKQTAKRSSKQTSKQPSKKPAKEPGKPGKQGQGAQKTSRPKSAFPSEARFLYPWRPYQERILSELDKHLDDRHFHVVAAPGSGKTVLGLEVVRRLNKPTLVLTPNLGIRDQWIQRFLDLFMGGRIKKRPPWISTDLKKPALLTVTTYQGLYADCKKNGAAEVVKRLKGAGIKALLFDEAHHLRQEWWKALAKVKEGFKNPFILALTATPPYDVPHAEWNRYAEICGEVDAEVSIPELVKAGTLCPHQDYIYFVEPSDELQSELDKFNFQTQAFLRDLALNREIIEAIKAHPLVADTGSHIDTISKNNEYFISLAVFLRHAFGVTAKNLLKNMGLYGMTLPPFNHIWAETLLQGMIFHDRESFAANEEAVKKLEEELYTYKAIERKKVHLQVTPNRVQALRSNPAKLKGVGEIVELESRLNHQLLRMVILTDYIREEDFPSLNHEDKPFTKIGVVPIFDHLRRLRLPGVNLGILTGSLVVLPKKVVPHLRSTGETLGGNPDAFKTKELWHDNDYVKVEAEGKERSKLVEIVTRLFTRGFINVLTGTTALLGEGWDAPAVNTLVMATVVGSYVASNQMRGRAIRVNLGNPAKTANIWHLACVGQGMTITEETDTDDLSLLARRFRSFPGLSTGEPAIESGLERMDIDTANFDVASAGELNAKMCEMAEDRARLGEEWKKALYYEGLSQRRMSQEILLKTAPQFSKKITNFTIKWNRLPKWIRWMGTWVLKQFEKAQRRKIVEKTRNIARILLFAFQELEIIRTPLVDIELKVIEGKNHLRVLAVGMPNREETVFIQALQDIYDPTWAPRYIIKKKDDIFCVPRQAASNKVKAECFLRHWLNFSNSGDLHYTQTDEGRTLLLQWVQEYLVSKNDYATRSRLRWS